ERPQARRRARSIRRRTSRRRQARARSRDRTRSARMGPDDRPYRPRDGGQLSIRKDDEGAFGEGEAEPEGPVRARRRRPKQGEVLQGEGRTGRNQRVRAERLVPASVLTGASRVLPRRDRLG